MDLKKVYEERRAINFFDTNKDISEELLKEIIDLSVLAPSAFNLQPWSIIAVRSKEAVKNTQQAAYNLYGTSEENKIKFAESNGGLLSMSIMYAAKNFGVDSHPMSGIDFEGIKKEFELSEDKTIVMTIALGYLKQDKTLYPRRARRGYDGIVKVL
ncbi:nitroreductase family protein [Clostridium sp. Marseille-Q7071]